MGESGAHEEWESRTKSPRQEKLANYQRWILELQKLSPDQRVRATYLREDIGEFGKTPPSEPRFEESTEAMNVEEFLKVLQLGSEGRSLNSKHEQDDYSEAGGYTGWEIIEKK